MIMGNAKLFRNVCRMRNWVETIFPQNKQSFFVDRTGGGAAVDLEERECDDDVRGSKESVPYPFASVIKATDRSQGFDLKTKRKQAHEKIEHDLNSCAFLVSIFVFLCANNFLQVVIVGAEETRIVEKQGLFPRVRHQKEPTCFENRLLDLHLFEVAQASRALIENEAGLRRDKLTEQFRITKIDFNVVHAEYTLVRRR